MFNAKIHTTKEEILRKIAEMELSIKTYRIAKDADPKKSAHYDKWIKFEKESLQYWQIQLDDMEATNNYEKAGDDY